MGSLFVEFVFSLNLPSKNAIEHFEQKQLATAELEMPSNSENTNLQPLGTIIFNGYLDDFGLSYDASRSHG